MKIHVQLDFDTATYDLMVSDHRMSPMPAGPRLYRAGPYPDIAFSHPTLEEAERAAGELRKYLAALPTKGQSKRELRKAAIV